ncbi:MAG: ATP-dependent sacrificial sulfur transferase LarE [Clostridia bacterium]|nr:ATP-dependent sacrificial sulfur transferase LarE [Clostridia bacterium]
MELHEFFRLHPKAAIAFSGGVDSAYLLYAALACGAQVRAYYVKSAFQPRFELEDARRVAELLHADMTVVEADVLDCPQIAANTPERCYHCKRRIFAAIAERAAKDGFETLLDGTNATDEYADRPGMRALAELAVLSPLRLCGISKDEVRRLSRQAGLFTWNKPAYACLATRIATGEAITPDKLERTERAEEFMSSLGFTDFRVRMAGDMAKLQVPAPQLEAVLERRRDILRELKQYYGAVALDLEVRDE